MKMDGVLVVDLCDSDECTLSLHPTNTEKVELEIHQIYGGLPLVIIQICTVTCRRIRTRLVFLISISGANQEAY